MAVGSAAVGRAAIVFQNGDFVAVEAEHADQIANSAGSGWTVATIDAPVAQSKESPAIDILPAGSNASGGAALFHEYGTNANDGQATYRFKFAEPGSYKFYLRTTSFESGFNTSHGNEDSLFRPTTLTGSPTEQFGTNTFIDGTYGWITNGPTYTVTAADVAAPFVEFRLDTREDGFSFDRLVLSQTTNLNASQLDALANSPQRFHAPFVYYSFESPDSDADGMATDFSGRHRDGTLSTTGSGSYQYEAAAPGALPGTQSLRLNENGNNNAARLSLDISPAELDFSNESWTFSGWYNRAETDASDFIFHLGSGDGFGGGNEFYLHGVENSTDLVLHSYFNSSQNVNLAVSGAAAPGEWRHVALVHDDDLGELLLYVDGTLAGTDDSFDLALPQSNWTLHFGGHDAAGFQASRWFNGNLDDLALFDRAFSADTIAALANGRMSPLEAPEPGAGLLALLAIAALAATRRRRKA
ncbi:MAG: LamG domain-containing protein [Thermoguttaceae bacterium]